MYLSRLRLWNFRKYCSGADNKPGVEVHFHEGLNVLIGENDSGKTAIIDAIRYVLRTQSGEYIQFDDKDFYQDEQGNRKDEFKIECVFDGLNEQDSGLFWEWLSWNEDKTRYLLKVWLYVKRKDNVILPKFSAGIEGQSERMDSEARDLLKVVYFKPLRDALTDMTHGYKSRLAQILGAHELFKTRKDERGNNRKHKLETDYEDLKREIENFFKKGGNGEIITEEINNFLHTHFLLNGDPRHAQIKLTGGELFEILRLLDLIMEGNKSGLGSLNLLCIAAEMLLFNNQQKGLKLALVEELEAHLHPQYQLRLIDYISSQQKKEQFILTTHSITLASKIRLENLIVLKGNEVFPMSKEYTMMKPADYKFLERFLDATKSNLFFAKGLIMVEGDAENLLIPAIADVMDKPLNKYGVSIVNVGSTAYKRYVNIFKRNDKQSFGMPVAVISDLDVRALEYYDDNSSDRKIPKYWLKDAVLAELKAVTEEVNYDSMASVFSSLSAFEKNVRANKTAGFGPIGETINRLKAVLTEEKKMPLNEDMLSIIRNEKTEHIEHETNNDQIKIFLPKDWTLEYDIAGSGLFRLLATDGTSPTRKISYQIFAPLNEGTISKAITAQYLAGMIVGDLPPVKDNDVIKAKIEHIINTDEKLKYLKNAIEYVTDHPNH